jgi:hypothetical protein
MRFERVRWVTRGLLALWLCAGASAACGSSSSNGPGPSKDGGLDTGVVVTLDGGASSSSSSSSSTDDGGTDSGLTIGLPGRPGQDMVAGGTLARSANFTLLLTVGESPGSNGVMTSTNDRAITGLVGTTTP